MEKELSEKELLQYEEVAKGLATKYGVPKVHVYVGIEPDTNKRIVAYIKEPSYLQKMYAMDKISTLGAAAAGEELREALTLREESDPLTYGAGVECDSYKLAIVYTCIGIIELCQNAFKKK